MSRRELRTGAIVWTDLTVSPEKASAIKDFYEAVAGWKSMPLEMDGYEDYNMTLPSNGKSAAGICQSRGPNSGHPAQWLIYIIVDDLDASMAECWAGGGRVILGPKELGPGERLCVIRDPVGAVAALIQQGTPGRI